MKFKNVKELVNDPRLKEVMTEAGDSKFGIIIHVCEEPDRNVFNDLYSNTFATASVSAPQSLHISSIASMLKTLDKEHNLNKEAAMGFVAILTNSKKEKL